MRNRHQLVIIDYAVCKTSDEKYNNVSDFNHIGMKGNWKDTYIATVVISIEILFGPRLISCNTAVHCEGIRMIYQHFNGIEL